MFIITLHYTITSSVGSIYTTTHHLHYTFLLSHVYTSMYMNIQLLNRRKSLNRRNYTFLGDLTHMVWITLYTCTCTCTVYIRYWRGDYIMFMPIILHSHHNQLSRLYTTTHHTTLSFCHMSIFNKVRWLK